MPLWSTPGESVNGIFVSPVTISPASVPANSTNEQVFNLPQAVAIPANMNPAMAAVEASKPSAQAGLAIGNARLVSTSQVALTFVNTTAGAIVPPANETYMLLIAW